jgi:hypothetical protein
MKADVIHTLTGATVLAVPGVNALTQLQKALEALRRECVEEIKTVFDMDLATNEHVQNGYRSLTELLSQMGFHFGTYLWDPQYKGLDDYIWEGCTSAIAPNRAQSRNRGGAVRRCIASYNKTQRPLYVKVIEQNR